MRIACDIDGVLVDVREYLEKYLPHDWEAYFSHTLEFPAIKPMKTLLYHLSCYPREDIYFVTGRPESNRHLTEQWFQKAGPTYQGQAYKIKYQ